MADAALAALRAAAGNCTRNGAGFTEQQRADGMVILNELRALFASAGMPVRHAVVRCPPLMEALLAELLALPAELLVAVIRQLDTRSLLRFACTCRLLYADRPRPMPQVEEALRLRTGERARFIPRAVPKPFNGWVPFLLRRDGVAAEQLSAAAGLYSSVFIDCDGRLLQSSVDAKSGSTRTPVSSLRDIAFQSVASSDWVSLALSEDRQVYVWGPAGDGPIGDGYIWYIEQEPQIVPGLQAINVSMISSGAWHSAALTADGALHTWSSWEYGIAPYGLGYEIDEDCTDEDESLHFAHMSPKRVQGALDGVRLRCVAAGYNYTLVASEEGELFSFGKGDQGLLGHGNDEYLHLPERVQALSLARGQVVKEVAAGTKCAMALTTEGEVFIWGGEESS
jgi:hypothetical protein